MLRSRSSPASPAGALPLTASSSRSVQHNPSCFRSLHSLLAEAILWLVGPVARSRYCDRAVLPRGLASELTPNRHLNDGLPEAVPRCAPKI